MRIEVPVLLYADIEEPEGFDGEFTEAVKAHVWGKLEHALGAVGEEPEQPHSGVVLDGFTEARIYLTDHLFSVNSFDNLALPSAETIGE